MPVLASKTATPIGEVSTSASRSARALAIDYLVKLYEVEGLEASLKIKRVLRDPNGPWRAGPVYLFIIDRNGFTIFHGAFPEKFELQAPTDTLRDAVTGELILPQIYRDGNPEPGGEGSDQSWSRRETPALYRIRLHESACYPYWLFVILPRSRLREWRRPRCRRILMRTRSW